MRAAGLDRVHVTKPSDFFAYPAWQPLAAVGSHGPGGELGLQICISIMGASIVPEKPRLLVVLWKQNYTHDLVAASASLCVSLLTANQLDTFDTLGLHTGRRGPKLHGIDVATTNAGNPFLPASAGYADCLVGDSIDLGDCTAFIAHVLQEERLTEVEPVTWEEAQTLLPDEVMTRYEEKFCGDRESASKLMRYFGP
jgi:flavin reductase (DIM6/NTAB) family NADH-FMN oxidoreductase RutF